MMFVVKILLRCFTVPLSKNLVDAEQKKSLEDQRITLLEELMYLDDKIKKHREELAKWDKEKRLF